MRKNRINRAVAVAAVCLLAASLAGCSGAAKSASNMDKLYDRETGRLFNGSDRERRGLAGQEGDELGNDPRSLEAQGDNMAMNGDFEGALFVYKRALVMAEKKQRMRLMGKAGQLTLRQGRYAETIGIMEKLTKDDPANANAWQTLGLAFLSMDDKARAEKALSKAAAFNPNLWKAHNALGIIYNHNKQPHKALLSFNKAIQKGPALAELFNNRALTYLLLKNPAQAEADWRRALAIKSDFKLAHNNLAILLAKRGDYQGAYSSFAKGSGNAEAHNNLGVMLAWRGKNVKAAKEFDMAMKRLPLYYPKANNHLSQVAGSGGRLNGPMVVDLTEDGYLVPADFRSPGPGSIRTPGLAKGFAAEPKPKTPLARVTPKKAPQKAAKAKIESETPRQAKSEKSAPEMIKQKAKPEAEPKEVAGPVSKQTDPRPELDLSRFSVPGRAGIPALDGPDDRESMLRAKPAAEPVSAVFAGGRAEPSVPEFAVARKVSDGEGKNVWRGDVRALFGNRD